MAYSVILSNPALDKIADDCGLVVDPLNLPITQAEICFFGEKVVRECIIDILSQKPEEGSTTIYNDLAQFLATKYGIEL